MSLQRAIPVLRMFCVERSKACQVPVVIRAALLRSSAARAAHRE